VTLPQAAVSYASASKDVYCKWYTRSCAFICSKRWWKSYY